MNQTQTKLEIQHSNYRLSFFLNERILIQKKSI